MVGIVGAEAAKFTAQGEQRARTLIATLLRPAFCVLVSGGCHLGGIDIWAEEEYANLRALEVGCREAPRPDPIIHLPRERKWSTGYKPRDLLIARDSAVVHNIVVDRYIPSFKGMRFERTNGEPLCYHCDRRRREQRLLFVTVAHVKSGGCWTAYEAEKLGKGVQWHVVRQ